MTIEADDIMSLDRYELEYLEWNGVPRDSFERELVWVRTDRSPGGGIVWWSLRMPG